LTLVFESGRPRALPSFSLAAVDAVTIGRAASPAPLADAGREDDRRLSVQVQDSRVSQIHCHLKYERDSWMLEDSSSTNGTQVNGAEIDRAELRHGDLVEVGRSFFLFRTDTPYVGGQPRSAQPPVGVATNNPGLAARFDRLTSLASSRLPVLVRGETGTGKELVAKAVHQLSRRTGALRAVNCGAVPRSLIESEFFGYRKGAFSGATEDRPGLVRSADKGTLFLDEIGDLPADGQAALLRVLQEGEVLPVGGVSPVPVDVRVVAATHRDLFAMAEQGNFRSDLLARLTGFVLVLPPLRDRLEDLGRLALHLVERHAGDGARLVEFSPRVIREMFSHQWHANIRELERVLSAALIFAGGGRIEWEHMEEALRADVPSSSPTPVHSAVPADRAGEIRSVERARILETLAATAGNQSEAARRLGISRGTLVSRIARYGIPRPRRPLTDSDR